MSAADLLRAIKKLSDDVEAIERRLSEDVEAIERRNAEKIKKLSEDVASIERRVNVMENPGNVDVEASKEEHAAVDDNEVNNETKEAQGHPLQKSFKTFDEAFHASGGDAEMERYKEMSQNLRKEIVSDVIQVQVETMLPSSIEWNGVSTLLVNQPYVRSIEELYGKADSAYEEFKIIIKEIASKTASKEIVPGLKDRGRAMRKAKFKYSDEDGNGVAYYRLTDIVRATLVFNSIADMYDGLEFINRGIKAGDYFDKIIEFNDRFETPVPNSENYRDLQLAVRLKDGFVCELQMSTKAVIQVKEMFGHRDYEVARRLRAALNDRDIDQMEAALAFGKAQLGTQCTITKEKFLPLRCYPLVIDAAKAGYADILDRLIECGADVNYLDEEGNTPLHYAVRYGHERCVWLLLDKHNCQTNLCNKHNETPLISGYVSFYSRPSEQSRRAITTLLQRSDEEQVKDTVRNFKSFVQKRLSQNMELVDCASVGNCERMRQILRSYGDPDSQRDQRSAIEKACTNGQVAAVELLLEFDAKVPHNSIMECIKANRLDIAKLLFHHSPTDMILAPTTIPCGLEGKHKFSGIAVCGRKLFCPPRNGGKILVIDGETDEIHTIPCSLHGAWLYGGIVAYGSKLFCAPTGRGNAVLVIDSITETTHTIPTKGGTWSDCVTYGRKIFFAPEYAKSILVIDGETEETHYIPCPGRVHKDGMWCGIAAYENKLFCAPLCSREILVINGDTEEMHYIPCGVKGDWKWGGIAAVGNKLFCPPINASSILVIDGDTEETHLISLGAEKGSSWRGICSYGRKLYCAPRNAESILVIDGDTEEINFMPHGVEGGWKFSGMAMYGNKLYSAPMDSDSVLVIKDLRPLLLGDS